MTKKLKRLTAMLLTVSMLIGTLCLPAFAVEEDTNLSYIHSTTVASADKNLFSPQRGLIQYPPKPGYTHVYAGPGNISGYLQAKMFNKPQPGHLNETPVYTDPETGISYYAGYSNHNTLISRILDVQGLYLNGKDIEGKRSGGHGGDRPHFGTAHCEPGGLPVSV